MKCEVKNTLEFNLKKCFTKPCVFEYLKSEELNVNLSDSNISMHYLLGVLYTSPMVLLSRICVTIKGFLSW